MKSFHALIQPFINQKSNPNLIQPIAIDPKSNTHQCFIDQSIISQKIYV